MTRYAFTMSCFKPRILYAVQIFEQPSKLIVGLERSMLEASGFDYRNREPQKLLIKICKYFHVDRETVGKTAYNISLDLYRTFAPLKQTTPTMAIACVELSARLFQQNIQELEAGKGFKKWKTSRQEVMGMCCLLREWLSDCCILMNNRNTAGSPRSLYAPPKIHYSRTTSSHRLLYAHSHCSQPRSIGE